EDYRRSDHSDHPRGLAIEPNDFTKPDSECREPSVGDAGGRCGKSCGLGRHQSVPSSLFAVLSCGPEAVTGAMNEDVFERWFAYCQGIDFSGKAFPQVV